MNDNINVQNNDEVLLRVEHLCQYFGSTKAVDDVTFDIKKGEVFGLVGESGCGKTTTGRSIIRLYDITSGNIYFKNIRIGAGTLSYKKAIAEARKNFKAKASKTKDKDELAALRNECAEIIKKQRANIKDARFDHKNCDKEYIEALKANINKEYEAKLAAATDPKEKKALKLEKKNALKMASGERLTTQIQMIFQDPIASLDPRMTVKEIISEGLAIKGTYSKEEMEEKVYEVLELVGLVREHANRYPHEFSGGQRQRIGVARSVIMKPDLIIADEPVSALDVSIQAQVINLLNELRQSLGLTILFVAHDLSVVKYFSDRIGVMYYGKMVELASSDELFKHPLHPYTKSLLSAIPLPDPAYEKKRKRITYNALESHDYSVDKPTFREILPGHFVQCNDAEFEQYKAEIERIDSEK